ncbi:MAG: DUF839 domain-containing protein [Geminicoccaceae bacterium]|nr:DUF839 domain-containing protein [Geminicoccaceae bacterium]
MKRYQILAGIALLGSTALGGPAAAELARIASVPLGAEITGLHLTEAGDFFMNIQHPATAITGPYNKATVGVFADADFNAVPEQLQASAVPDSDFEKQTVMTSIGTYQVLAQQGDFADAIPDGLGAILTAGGKIMKSSNDPDFNGFIPIGDNEGYLFTNWEDQPGGMSRMKLVKGDDGRMTVDPEDVRMLDFSSVNGTWINCFGSVSPWNTPLTSEELYFDTTENWIDASAGEDFEGAETTRTYLGGPSNPYDYGYIVEITDPAGAATPVKHYAMGRFSHENSVVMPDRKTAYLSDDGTDTVFFKFVADNAGDLSAGTLYAAKATQNGENGGSSAEVGFTIEWVELAHASNDQIAAWIGEYAGKTAEDSTDGAEYISDEDVAAWAAGEAADDRAAFLESRKAAAAKGATAEWRKMEGIMANFKAIENGSAPYLYMAMSEISKGMSDGEGDINIAENMCGAVYELSFDETYNITGMTPLVAGHGYDKNEAANPCPVDSISNPDNVAVLDDGRVIIGEDTGNHENNTLWLFTKPQS